MVQDLFPSPLVRPGDYLLPAAAFAEREGSYVNRADRLQTAQRAIRPPGGVRTEGSLYWELLGIDGPVQCPGGAEVAREILYFSAAAGPVPDVGIDLKLNLLAGNHRTENKPCLMDRGSYQLSAVSYQLLEPHGPMADR